MDNNLFKLVNLGICSYYLIVRSCFQIYAETFYLSPQEDATIIVWTFGVALMMLSAGVFFFSRYRKEQAVCTCDVENASKTVELIGGSLIFAMMLLFVIRGLCYYSYSSLNLFFNPAGPLFSILFYMPFIIVAAVTIVKGLKTKERRPLPGYSVCLWFLSTALFVLYTCSRGLLVKLMELAAFQNHESRPQELYWICIQFVFAAAALILFAAPLGFKNKFKTADNSYGIKLTAQSLITGGTIILINESINILNFLISILTILASDYEEFIREFSEVLRERLVGQMLPELVFLIIGLAAIYYGNKKGPQS